MVDFFEDSFTGSLPAYLVVLTHAGARGTGYMVKVNGTFWKIIQLWTRTIASTETDLLPAQKTSDEYVTLSFARRACWLLLSLRGDSRAQSQDDQASHLRP
jgi:hypothetical protein